MSAPSNPAPHWQGHRGRLRTKLIARGAGAGDDYELLETLLFAFIPRKDVKPIAKALLKEFGSVSAVLATEPDKLMAVNGIGEKVAAYIKTVAELAARAAREEIKSRPIVSSWTTLLTYVQTELQHQLREQFRVLFLDRKKSTHTRRSHECGHGRSSPGLSA